MKQLPGKLSRIVANPALAIIIAFLASIAVGTGLLMLPAATHRGLSVIDAIFTSTSAICVTGLTVQDTASYFTPLGQGIILFLIQIGGMGILTISAFCIRAISGRLGFSARSWMEESITQNQVPHIYAFLKRVLLFVFLMEIVGAALLFLVFQRDYPWPSSLYHAVFHSISAFCNAGFSTFPDSLVPYRYSATLNGVIMVLIIAGGIGFFVVEELRDYLTGKSERLSLHTRIVVLASLALIIAGGLFVFFMERNHSFSHFSTGDKILSAFFQSITCRTAGFYTVSQESFSVATLFLCILLMFIGGSPGSTAGGIKTTSFVLLLAIIVARLRGRKLPEIAHRTISDNNAQKVLTLLLAVLLLIVATVFILTISEGQGEFCQKNPRPFLTIVFEVVSAFGTVGLSLGITPFLSSLGKMTIVLLMFIGRIGPLTLAIYLMTLRENLDYTYPEETVMIG